jgi:hypothetical protein
MRRTHFAGRLQHFDIRGILELAGPPARDQVIVA